MSHSPTLDRGMGNGHENEENHSVNDDESRGPGELNLQSTTTNTTNSDPRELPPPARTHPPPPPLPTQPPPPLPTQPSTPPPSTPPPSTPPPSTPPPSTPPPSTPSTPPPTPPTPPPVVPNRPPVPQIDPIQRFNFNTFGAVSIYLSASVDALTALTTYPDSAANSLSGIDKLRKARDVLQETLTAVDDMALSGDACINIASIQASRIRMYIDFINSGEPRERIQKLTPLICQAAKNIEAIAKFRKVGTVFPWHKVVKTFEIIEFFSGLFLTIFGLTIYFEEVKNVNPDVGNLLFLVGVEMMLSICEYWLCSMFGDQYVPHQDEIEPGNRMV